MSRHIDPTDPEAYDWAVEDGERMADDIASERDPFGWQADRLSDRYERAMDRQWERGAADSCLVAGTGIAIAGLWLGSSLQPWQVFILVWLALFGFGCWALAVLENRVTRRKRAAEAWLVIDAPTLADGGREAVVEALALRAVARDGEVGRG